MITESPASKATTQASAKVNFCLEVQCLYDPLLQRLASNDSERSRLRCVALCAPTSGQGTSTVAAHLAATAAARGGAPGVLLIDANFQRPVQHRTFGVGPQPGLAEMLTEQTAAAECIQQSPVANLALLPAGDGSQLAAETLDPEAVRSLLRELNADFDIVVVDVPPLLESEVAAGLAGMADGVVLVVQSGRNSSAQAQTVTSLLVRHQARLLGTVLNQPLAR